MGFKEQNTKNKKRITVEEINRYDTRRKILKIVATAAVILLAIIYLFAALYKQRGSFTVTVNKHEMVTYGLSLCETRDLSRPTSVLNMRIDEAITNIAEEDLPDNLDMIDGEHNGDNHIAFTFYLFNASDVNEVNYEWQVKMSNIYNGIDEAIRLRIYVDGVPTKYAKTASDGSGPEPNTTEFYSSDVVAMGRYDNFTTGSVTKFTIVVWLEGTDPDCLDWIKGGKMRFEFNARIVH
jgi:hypothetical protein